MTVNTTRNPDPIFDPQEAADYLNEEKRTLDNKRSRAEGPDYIKTGRLVRYRKSDLDRYLDARTIRIKGNEGPKLSASILNYPSLISRVAKEMHVTPEIAQRHINNARRILELAGG